MPLLSEISKGDHTSGTPLSIHLQQYQGVTRMTSNKAHLQPHLSAEQDGAADSQLTFNPAYDTIDQQEHILASESENMQEQV